MHLLLFTDHTYMFRSPSATILRVYSIKGYNKKFVWRISPRSRFTKCYNIILSTFRKRVKKKLTSKWIAVGIECA
jgi:hypothetical protein